MSSFIEVWFFIIFKSLSVIQKKLAEFREAIKACIMICLVFSLLLKSSTNAGLVLTQSSLSVKSINGSVKEVQRVFKQ